ncbi:MAG: 3-deoxy-D-manno-octulosonic acid transferase [Paracoccaceae bacterium]|nr:MAG: 3-deoxy-D-manno-octulosonic acid transferase [Paracoccaceae bacterium]
MSLRWFLPLYGLLWHLGLPVVLAYLWWRGRRDPRYRAHLAERFGLYRQRMAGPVWVHAVSLGEVRSAVPVIRALLDRGERVVITHFTPAGRSETDRAFAAEIAGGQLASVWVPLETSWACNGFFRAFRPRAGLVMEVEHWPRMILSAQAAGVPLFPCNAQYPAGSFDRDRTRRRWRFQAVGRYAGAMVKSDLQAARFRSAGLTRIAVTGETRFDQPLPRPLVAAGTALRQRLAAGRPTLAIASAVEGEDDLYVNFIRLLRADFQRRDEPAPLVIYVPRQPARFGAAGDLLTAAGLRVERRSAILSRDFRIGAECPEMDVFLGDSIGEMFGYLAMADRVIVGGGFTPRGAHNIIEPLKMGRPVLTGPVTWPIEYPFEEARAAGIAQSVPDAEGLLAGVLAPPPDPADIAAFVAAHSGAAARTLAALDRFTSR